VLLLLLHPPALPTSLPSNRMPRSKKFNPSKTFELLSCACSFSRVGLNGLLPNTSVSGTPTR
jgi:hypothetical protein